MQNTKAALRSESIPLYEAYRAGKFEPTHLPILYSQSSTGQNNGFFVYTEGNSRVDHEADGTFIRVAAGLDSATVCVPKQPERIVRETRKQHILKRKSTWIIILLIMIVAIGVIVGLVVHELHTNDGESSDNSA
jgi:hypothetical protein